MAAAYDVGNSGAVSDQLGCVRGGSEGEGSGDKHKTRCGTEKHLIMMHSSSSLGELAVLWTHVRRALYRISQSIVTDGQRRS